MTDYYSDLILERQFTLEDLFAAYQRGARVGAEAAFRLHDPQNARNLTEMMFSFRPEAGRLV